MQIFKSLHGQVFCKKAKETLVIGKRVLVFSLSVRIYLAKNAKEALAIDFDKA